MHRDRIKVTPLPMDKSTARSIHYLFPGMPGIDFTADGLRPGY